MSQPRQRAEEKCLRLLDDLGYAHQDVLSTFNATGVRPLWSRAFQVGQPPLTLQVTQPNGRPVVVVALGCTVASDAVAIQDSGKFVARRVLVQASSVGGTVAFNPQVRGNAITGWTVERVLAAEELSMQSLSDAVMLLLNTHNVALNALYGELGLKFDAVPVVTGGKLGGHDSAYQ